MMITMQPESMQRCCCCTCIAQRVWLRVHITTTAVGSLLIAPIHV